MSNMATETAALVTVQTRIEPDVHRLLEEKRQASDRSLAAEIRQAIRAWVDEPVDSAEAAA